MNKMHMFTVDMKDRATCKNTSYIIFVVFAVVIGAAFSTMRHFDIITFNQMMAVSLPTGIIAGQIIKLINNYTI